MSGALAVVVSVALIIVVLGIALVMLAWWANRRTPRHIDTPRNRQAMRIERGKEGPEIWVEGGPYAGG